MMEADIGNSRRPIMYPSGTWRGYWEQEVFGRQPMEGLTLCFADGVITGHGSDVIGPFVFRGNYEADGSVALTKQYLGRHRVHYQGVWDGEGTIHGIWSIPPFHHGKFALMPDYSAEASTAIAEAPIHVIRPGP
jgi:hypothetical protein